MDKKRYFEIRSTLRAEKSFGPLVYYFIINGCLVALAMLAAISHVEYLAIVPITTLMFRNFGLMHDAVHNAVSDRRWLNNLIGEICGCLCFLPFETWKRSHLDHHIWSGNIEKDPVMALRITLPKVSQKLQKILTLSWRAWIPILAALQQVLFWRLCLQRTLQTKSFISALRFLLPAMFWASVLILTSARMLWLGVIPGFWLYLVAVEVVNFPHHLQLPMTSGDTRHPIWEQYQSSRTCLYPRWFAHLFVMNFNYHTEHHMFPDLPWYMLEGVHEIVRAELKEKENIDINLGWIFENRSKSLVEVVQPIKPIELKKIA